MCASDIRKEPLAVAAAVKRIHGAELRTIGNCECGLHNAGGSQLESGLTEGLEQLIDVRGDA
jgi:hypothetical protein